MGTTEEVLAAEARAVADEYTRRWGGGANLHGQCVEASLDLAWRLFDLGYEGVIADGHHRTPFAWPEGDTSPVTGHTWVEVHGLILDPTRAQLAVAGADRVSIPLDDPEARLYVRERGTVFEEEFGPSATIPST